MPGDALRNLFGMAIYLYTDFGAGDIYVGQMKAAIHDIAPQAKVIDLLHEAPCFDVKAGAHLLAALAGAISAGSVIVAVVDPGVGGARAPVALRADGRWFVGPDNGLISVVAARAGECAGYLIKWRPPRLSDSFHGRDLFAPVAALIDGNLVDPARAWPARPLAVTNGGDDLAEIIYIDHYGNAMTGLRAGSVDREHTLGVNGQRLRYARVFSEVEPGQAFWYENSLGLIEIAVNGGSASRSLDMAVGQRVDLDVIG